jgi:hypothetical protein
VLAILPPITGMNYCLSKGKGTYRIRAPLYNEAGCPPILEGISLIVRQIACSVSPRGDVISSFEGLGQSSVVCTGAESNHLGGCRHSFKTEVSGFQRDSGFNAGMTRLDMFEEGLTIRSILSTMALR